MKNSRNVLIGILAVILLAGTFSGGILVGWAVPKGSLGLANLSLPTLQPKSNSERDKLFAPFWETWDIVHTQYVDQPVNDEKMMQGAIRGMLDSLGDPHTAYMDPDLYRQVNMPLQGAYEGIGAWVDITGDYLKIISPMPDSPAQKAGLQAEDLVIAIDSKDMTGVDGNAVLKQILGPAGTKVTLKIQRVKVSDPFDVTIERAKITIPSVQAKMLDNQIGYIQLFTFGDKTAQDLHTKLVELIAQKPVGLILDLRNNGGGFVNTAVDIISEFLPANKVLMIEQSGDGKRETLTTKGGGVAIDIPLVVLVNGGSASASEITAGAIQDYKRGVLVGVKTFGKGSVQNWIPLADNEGAIRVTIARWLTPNEHQINKLGLNPDYVVELTQDDINAKHDVQLDKAMELLKK